MKQHIPKQKSPQKQTSPEFFTRHAKAITGGLLAVFALSAAALMHDYRRGAASLIWGVSFMNASTENFQRANAVYTKSVDVYLDAEKNFESRWREMPHIRQTFLITNKQTLEVLLDYSKVRRTYCNNHPSSIAQVCSAETLKSLAEFANTLNQDFEQERVSESTHPQTLHRLELNR